MNKTKEIQFRLVFIEWEDALSRDGWHEIDAAKEWAKEKDIMLDVGWLIEKNKKYILISPSWSDKTKMFDYLKKIPMSVVRKIDYFKNEKRQNSTRNPKM